MTPIDRARCFAALSGPFDPVEAFAPRAEGKSEDVAVVASQLAVMCDTHPQGAEGKWLMRTSERRDILKMLRDDNALDDYIAARRGAADAETGDLLDAILGNGLFAPADIEQAVASLESRGLIERIVVAVDRAGEIAPAYPLLQRARSALGLLDRQDRWEKLKAHGVYGRDDQRRVIDKWLKRPIVKAPVRALFVSGLPGIGKSLLLDDSVRAALDSEHALLVRLDFDRAGLDVLDQLALTMEVARQVAEQIGERGPELLKKRLEAASFDARPDGPTLSEKSLFPSMLAGEIGAAAGGRPFLFLLDTMEVLRNRGETHPETLFVWLDRLVESGLQPMRVLAAGRGQPLDRIPKRIGQEIDLEGLADPAADAMLEQLGVPPEIRSEIQALADGNPLVLRLGAELASKAEPGAFREKRRKKELASAFLYRVLLSRLNDKALLLVATRG